MRLRKIAGADEAAAGHSRVWPAQEAAVRLAELAGGRKIYLEIGMGKGDFLLGMAAKYRESFFLGMEKYSSVLIKALAKYDKLEPKPDNIGFLWEDAREMDTFFRPVSLDGLYLNFSDPWPKERYAKRRLTAPGFLKLYAGLLKPGSTVEFKTDNEALFRFSIDSFGQDSNWEIEKVYWDLHREVPPIENVMTEYEKKFSEKGQPIYKLTARLKVPVKAMTTLN